MENQPQPHLRWIAKTRISPSRVDKVILSALTDKHMQTRYSVGIESHAVDFLRPLPAILRASLLRRHFKL